MDDAEDPVAQAGQKALQYAALAQRAAETIMQVRQQRAAATAAAHAQAAATTRAERTAALTAARVHWQPLLDGRLRNRVSVADAGLAWAAAQAWRQVDPQAELVSERAAARLRELRPDVMERFDRLTSDGLDPVEAMRRVAPFFDQPASRPGGQTTRSSLPAPAAGRASSGPDAHPMPTGVDTSSGVNRQPTIPLGRDLPGQTDAAAVTASSNAAPAGRAGSLEDPRYPAAGDDPATVAELAAAAAARGGGLRHDTAAPAVDAATGNTGLVGPRSAAELARDGFPEPLTAQVLAAGRVHPKAPATTAPAAVRSAGLATAARAASRTR